MEDTTTTAKKRASTGPSLIANKLAKSFRYSSPLSFDECAGNIENMSHDSDDTVARASFTLDSDRTGRFRLYHYQDGKLRAYIIGMVDGSTEQAIVKGTAVSGRRDANRYLVGFSICTAFALGLATIMAPDLRAGEARIGTYTVRLIIISALVYYLRGMYDRDQLLSDLQHQIQGHDLNDGSYRHRFSRRDDQRLLNPGAWRDDYLSTSSGIRESDASTRKSPSRSDSG